MQITSLFSPFGKLRLLLWAHVSQNWCQFQNDSLSFFPFFLILFFIRKWRKVFILLERLGGGRTFGFQEPQIKISWIVQLFFPYSMTGRSESSFILTVFANTANFKQTLISIFKYKENNFARNFYTFKSLVTAFELIHFENWSLKFFSSSFLVLFWIINKE